MEGAARLESDGTNHATTRTIQQHQVKQDGTLLYGMINIEIITTRLPEEAARRAYGYQMRVVDSRVAHTSAHWCSATPADLPDALQDKTGGASGWPPLP